MVDNTWARLGDAPTQFALPDQADELATRYAPYEKSIQLQNILDYVEELGGDLALVEAPYVDFDYRSEYSNLYARSFNPPPDKCERLVFLAGDKCLGFLVVRPTPKPVGRTAIAPPASVAPFLCCGARHSLHPHGIEYQVEAWPFVSQDGVYGRCAHAAIWSIARYHHLHHNCPRHSIAAVVETSGARPSVDKTFPSAGLYLHEVSEAFAKLGLPALPYTPDRLPSGQDLEAIICRYLNSGFPVALSTSNHLTVLIGYGHKGDDLFFIRSDDNVEPYERVDSWSDGADRLDKWEALLVPLPARIHVPGEAAETHAKLAFIEQAGATDETEDVLRAYADDELRFRTYAVDAAKYKMGLEGRRLPAEIVRHHQRVPTPVWLWITEVQRRSEDGERKRVVAEVAIDATSHPRRPDRVFANLPGRAVAWLPDEEEPRAKSVPRADLHDSAMALRIDRG